MYSSPLRTVIPALLLTFALTPPSRANETWTGPYLGIEGVAIAGNDHGKEHELDNGAYNGWKQDLNLDGSGIGLLAGYDWQANSSWLFGLEFGYRRHDASDSVYQVFESNTTYCTPPSDCTIGSKVTDAFSLTGRIGYLIADNTLLYGLAGFTTAHIERVIQDWAANGSTRYEYDKWQEGWTAGIGAEHRLSKHVSARLQYRYTDLGSHDFQTPAYRGVIEKYDYRQEEVSLAINYRF